MWLAVTARDGRVLLAPLGEGDRLALRSLGIRGAGSAAATTVAGQLCLVVLGRDGRYARHNGTAAGGWSPTS